LNRAANAALQAPSVRQGLEAGGYEIVGGTPGAFRDLLRQEVEKWTDLVQRAGIRRGP
jgi:tripartite-type tricarboxylate transporter receptor subunit TctC